MNIAIQTSEELICLYTSSMDRAKEVCNKGNVDVIDIYEVSEKDMEFYYFDSRLHDPKFINNK